MDPLSAAWRFGCPVMASQLSLGVYDCCSTDTDKGLWHRYTFWLMLQLCISPKTACVHAFLPCHLHPDGAGSQVLAAQVSAYLLPQADKEPVGEGRSSLCDHLLLSGGPCRLGLLRHVSRCLPLQSHPTSPCTSPCSTDLATLSGLHWPQQALRRTSASLQRSPAPAPAPARKPQSCTLSHALLSPGLVQVQHGVLGHGDHHPVSSCHRLPAGGLGHCHCRLVRNLPRPLVPQAGLVQGVKHVCGGCRKAVHVHVVMSAGYVLDVAVHTAGCQEAWGMVHVKIAVPALATAASPVMPTITDTPHVRERPGPATPHVARHQVCSLLSPGCTATKAVQCLWGGQATWPGDKPMPNTGAGCAGSWPTASCGRAMSTPTQSSSMLSGGPLLPVIFPTLGAAFGIPIMGCPDPEGNCRDSSSTVLAGCRSCVACYVRGISHVPAGVWSARGSQ